MVINGLAIVKQVAYRTSHQKPGIWTFKQRWRQPTSN